MKVITVQYFCKHQVTVRTSYNVRGKHEHVLCVLEAEHRCEDWYSIQQLSVNMNEPPSVCVFFLTCSTNSFYLCSLCSNRYSS